MKRNKLIDIKIKIKSMSIVTAMVSLMISFADADTNKIKKTNNTTAQGITEDARFISNENGTVVDKMLGLMWAASDNGKMITWEEALEYCNTLRLGGYLNWRMPTLQELATLYVSDKPNPKPPTENCSGGYYIHYYFHITCCCIWAKGETGEKAAYPFNVREAFWHHQSGFTGKRVLPVRKIDNQVLVKGFLQPGKSCLAWPQLLIFP